MRNAGEVGKISRRGWSGELPDPGFHATPPAGWQRLFAEGFGVLPFLGGGAADPSWSPDHSGGGDSGGDSGGDGGGGDGGGGHDGGF